MRTLIHGGDIVAYDQGGHRLLRSGTGKTSPPTKLSPLSFPTLPGDLKG